MEDGPAPHTNGYAIGESVSKPRNLSTTAGMNSNNVGHKRSLSGSLISKFLFRTSDEPSSPQSPAKSHMNSRATEPFPHDSSVDDDGTTSSMSHAMSTAARMQTKTRKRKGSLRKTAILGTNKLRTDVLGGRRNSIRQNYDSNSPLSASPSSPVGYTATSAILSPISPATANIIDGDRTPRRFSYEVPAAASSEESGWASSETAATPPIQDAENQALASPEIQTEDDAKTPRVGAAKLGSPVTSPPLNPYASTTSDEDGLSLKLRPSASGGTSSEKSTSYFPVQAGASSTLPQRRRSTQKSLPSHPPPTTTKPAYAPSPLSHITSDEDTWDYTETEYWGWTILVTTWLVFVVGMGSSLGVWSWAWDVGETPYAPPELEDDPTLPIVGYYPALMVLTAVMAWVWVVVAWVGMKYFRHARGPVEDT